jgi:hypothetical protein
MITYEQGKGPRFAAGQTDIKIVMRTEARFEGRIVDKSTGAGVPRVRITVLPKHPTNVFDVFQCVSRQDGSFSISGLPGGHYLLTGEFPTLHIDLEPGQTNTNAIIECPGVVQGRVTGSGGEPIANAAVEIEGMRKEGEILPVFSARAQTDGQGYYRCCQIDGPYHVSFSYQDNLPSTPVYRYRTAWLPKPFEGSQTIDFQSPPLPTGTARLTGQVTDQYDRPLGEFVAVDLRKQRNKEEALQGQLKISYHLLLGPDDPAFEFDNLPAGPYQLSAISAKEHIDHYSEPLTLVEGQTSTVTAKLTKKEPKKTTFYGRVLYEDGKPAMLELPPWPGSSVRVSIWPPTWGNAGPFNVDSEGYFAAELEEDDWERFRSGDGELRIYHPSYEKRGSNSPVGTFAHELLARDKSSAGTVKIKRPMSRPSSLQGKPLPVWITFLPRSPIRSLDQYRHSWHIDSLVPGDGQVKSCELEIRSAADNWRIAKVRYERRYPIRGGSGRWGCRLTKLQVDHLEDGRYAVAFYANGIRCSNIAEFTVDSNADLSTEPILQLVPLPLGPGQRLARLGIRAVGPSPADPKLTYSAIGYPELIVDGTARRPKGMKWAGQDPALNSGEQGVMILDLSNYEPAIEPGVRHKVWAKVGKYESATIVIPVVDSFGPEWDRITEERYPRLPEVVVLEGRVVGTGDKPAIYKVALDKDGKVFETQSDADGRYELVNVPPGKYQLGCHPPNEGLPNIVIQDFQIEQGKKLVQDLNFKVKYSFSGEVTYEDGSPAVAEVTASWTGMDGKAEYHDSARTDHQGHYTLASPFELASAVGIVSAYPGGERPMPKYHRNVRAGRADVDFVLEKSGQSTEKEPP